MGDPWRTTNGAGWGIRPAAFKNKERQCQIQMEVKQHAKSLEENTHGHGGKLDSLDGSRIVLHDWGFIMIVKDLIDELKELDPELPVKFKVLLDNEAPSVRDEWTTDDEGIMLHHLPEMGQVGGSHAYMEFYIE